MDSKENPIEELKIKIIQTLGFEDIKPQDIDPDEPLVGGSLDIDSIDVLELVMMLEKDYAIIIDSKELGAKVFASLRALAEYVGEHRSNFKEQKAN